MSFNPRYAESLDRMADTLVPILAAPISDTEIHLVEQPLFITTAADLPAMRSGLDCTTAKGIPDDETELLRGIAAPTLTRKRYKLPQVITAWETFDDSIRPKVVRSQNIVAFATRQTRDMEKFGNTESFALTDEEQTISLAAATRIIFSRLDASQRDCANTFADDDITKLYKRIAKPALDYGLDLQRTIDTPTEGIVSIMQAASQIEADFKSRSLPPPSDKVLGRMILSYTSQVTYGYFGEMSLRGFRFADQFNTTGAMHSRYHAFFEHLQATHQRKSSSNGFVPANDGEGCPAAKRAKGASQAVLTKFADPYLSVRKEVKTLIQAGRIMPPKFRHLSAITTGLAEHDQAPYDVAMCRNIPVQ